MVVYFSPEDQLLNAIGRRLIAEISHDIKVTPLGRMGGKGNLRKRMPNFLQMARQGHKVIVLTDLDNHVCAPQLVAEWVGNVMKPDFLCLRVAVKESEGWLLADHEGINDFFSNRRGLSSNLPRDSDLLNDPKLKLLQLTRQFAPRDIRADILPTNGGGSSVGTGYNQQLSSYVERYWSPVRASARSDSLMRTRNAIRELLES